MALTTISVRIGWCQPGENRPDTISASGSPKTEGDGLDRDYVRDLLWFRAMWLSNSDFVHLFDRAIHADPTPWPRNAIIVNGMSNNTPMPWNLQEAESLIGYKPRDNIFQLLPR